jgi:hypothetical protein
MHKSAAKMYNESIFIYETLTRMHNIAQRTLTNEFLCVMIPDVLRERIKKGEKK